MSKNTDGTSNFRQSSRRFEEWVIEECQKQPPEVLYEKKVFLENLENTQESTCVLSLFFNKKRPATLLKRRHWHRCFPVNFAKFLGTTFLQNT